MNTEQQITRWRESQLDEYLSQDYSQDNSEEIEALNFKLDSIDCTIEIAEHQIARKTKELNKYPNLRFAFGNLINKTEAHKSAITKLKNFRKSIKNQLKQL